MAHHFWIQFSSDHTPRSHHSTKFVRHIYHPIHLLDSCSEQDGVIGRANTIPWHYPADLRHFRRVTRGHAVLAGRVTYETFKPCPLPQRLNFVLTHDPAYPVAEGVIVCTSLADVLAYNHKKLLSLAVFKSTSKLYL